jgi:hypothetical protein
MAHMDRWSGHEKNQDHPVKVPNEVWRKGHRQARKHKTNGSLGPASSKSWLCQTAHIGQSVLHLMVNLEIAISHVSSWSTVKEIPCVIRNQRKAARLDLLLLLTKPGSADGLETAMRKLKTSSKPRNVAADLALVARSTGTHPPPSLNLM